MSANSTKFLTASLIALLALEGAAAEEAVAPYGKTLKASLLTGLETPLISGEKAPVLIKVRDCIVYAEAEIDLATERFVMEATSMSCDGKPIRPAHGYVVDREGMMGMPFSIIDEQTEETKALPYARLPSGTEGGFIRVR